MVKLTVHDGGKLGNHNQRDIKKEVLRIYTQKLRDAVEQISPDPVLFEINRDAFEIYRISVQKDGKSIRYGVIDNVTLDVYLGEDIEGLTSIQLYHATGLNFIVDTLGNQAIFDYCMSKFEGVRIRKMHEFQKKFKNGKKELHIPLIQVIRLKPHETLDQIMGCC